MLTDKELYLYFSGAKKHKAYDETVRLYKEMQTHADGEVPEKLISERRPSESEEVLAYRKQIYVPITKNPISKVITSLSKIRRSPDWAIIYDPKTIPSTILKEETLESYCEYNYPEHGSVTNWVFSHLLKNYCIDANAVVLSMPNNPDAASKNEYYKPVAMIFNSPNVLYYEDGADYAVLKSTEKSDLINDEGILQYQTGEVFYYVTTTEIVRYDQTAKGEFQVTKRIVHNRGKIPVFKIRGQFLKQKDSVTINESRLSPMLPGLVEAAREYSDLQGAKVQHMFPLFWYFQNKSCGSCDGLGKVSSGTGSKECSHCGGSGKVKFSPYAHMEIDPPKLGEIAVQSPPAGYISRDVEIIKHQDTSVDKHLYRALASINMQFLDQTPLNISGEAKQTDREELNNFTHGISEDIVFTMDKVYWWVNEWRYSVVVPDPEKRKLMLPSIPVPENFDLLPADYLVDEISKAKNAKVNPILVAAMEQDYATKKFYTTPNIAKEINCIYQLDPLPGYTVDEKQSLLTNKAVTQEDIVISANIVSFVRRAIAENDDFLSMSLDKKAAIIKKYTADKITLNDKAEQIKKAVLLEDKQAASGVPESGKSNGAKPSETKSMTSEDVGKIPLALQQLTLAATRASELGNTKLANQISKKVTELLNEINL